MIIPYAKTVKKARITNYELSIKQRIMIFALVIIFNSLFLIHVPTAHAIVRAPSNLGLVGYWSMEDCKKTRATDFSGNGNHGTLTNFVLSGSTSNWVTGTSAKRGCALAFDGSNDFVTMGDPASGIHDFGTGDFSISAWAKMSSLVPTNGRYFMVAKESIVSPWPGYDFGIVDDGGTGSYLRLQTCNTTCPNVKGTTNLVANRWYHFIGIRTGGKLWIYINGALENSATVTALNISNSTNLYIGERDDGYNFNGSIDEVRIYNRALSATEVANLYNSGLTRVNASTADLQQGTNLASGLVGHWTFDGKYLTTTTSTDTSGQGNHGTLLPSTSTPKAALGKLGQALSFDGVNDYVDIANESNFDQVNYLTVSGWVKINTSATRGGMASKSPDGGSAGGGWYFDYGGFNSGQMEFGVIGGSGIYIFGGAPMSKGVWHHVVGVFNKDLSGNARVALYIDGVAQSLTYSTLGTFTTILANNTQVVIGRSSLTSTFLLNGSLDDVRIYNRALSAAEVLQLYNLGTAKIKAPNNLGLVGYWSFNECKQTRADDFSGNGNRGTLTNFALSGSTSNWVSGSGAKQGCALNFDGVNDYVDAGSATIIDDLPALTASAWIKPLSAGESSVGRIFDKTTGHGPTNGWTFNMSNNSIQFNVDTSGAVEYRTSSAGIITFGNWYHVVVTWDGSLTASNIHMYVNGSEVSYSDAVNGSGSRDSDASASLRIGLSSANARAFNGSIDEVRLYNRALSATEVLKLYNTTR